MDKWILGGRKDVCIANWPGPAQPSPPVQPKGSSAQAQPCRPSPAMQAQLSRRPGPAQPLPSRAWKPGSAQLFGSPSSHVPSPRGPSLEAPSMPGPSHKPQGPQQQWLLNDGVLREHEGEK
jgi:hypothetical protein